MPSPTSTIKKFLDQNKDNAKPDLLITFPSGTAIPAPATKADKPSTSQQPTFSLAQSCLRTHVPGAKYMAVSLDLDAPSPSLPLASPILHYLHTDLTAATASPFASPSPVYKTDTATDTWVQLTASSVTAGGKGTLEKPLTSWLAPAPPGFSAPHRYVFLVWEQPEKMSGEQVRAKLGLGKGEAGLWRKSRFDIEGFVRKLKLGKIVAGTWMVVGS
ncbi:hypothetical protein P171DRAFT_108202 [Karstenula rhodostoma CBS 690.94]|uniref:PEBP-like protein n=1 Tax=Karstenula rhodostoma CBS 690.94 TaxID=1392251 RepID=A0A9P4U835_9PLEO|nr:hypothetical protein P171DRAFT_108202 [Karstenula rhodostoma CBS 690.94]